MTEVYIGTLTDLPTDTGTRFEHAGEVVAVFRKDDEAYALADRCSHAEASLSEGDLFDDEIECPLHGASFDIATGKALTLPATQPVRVYPTEVRDGSVYVTFIPQGDADA